MIMILLAIGIKVLVMDCYRSTDFDVHHNWMRLTAKPMGEWYYDEQSIWTLDYPPLFAYFEYFLGILARSMNLSMISVTTGVVYFQRISVIVSEILYFYAINKNNHCNTHTKYFLQLLPFGCFLIDNIHFQYNGFLYGMLLFAISAFHQGSYLKGSVILTVLLCFKHIYIYVVPAFALLLLKNCSIKQIIKIGTICISMVIVIFLPFITHIPQILSRLFPFKRGLVHSYWAQNFWSLYCFADKVLGKVLGINVANTTSGVVQETIFNILPKITPLMTLIIIVIALGLILPKKKNTYTVCSLSSILFFNWGFHVHEKAIMIPIIIELASGRNPKLTFLASWINGVALLPLIPVMNDRWLLLIAFLIYHSLFFKEYQLKIGNEKFYLYFGVVLAIYGLINPWKSLEYLPLMLHSLYGAIFNQWWIYMLCKEDDLYIKVN